jgi:hypothetical protein
MPNILPLNIIDEGHTHPGAILGRAFGGGISAGLNALTQSKLQEIDRHNKYKGLEALGFSKQESEDLSRLPDNLLPDIIKNRQQQQNQSQFENALYGNQGSFGQYQQPDQFNNLMQQSKPQPQYQNLQQATPWGANNYQQQSPQNQGTIQQPQRTQEQRAPMLGGIPKGLTPQQYNQFINHKEKQQAQANATNKKFIDDLQASVGNSQRMISLVDQMDDLLKTGHVSTGLRGKLPLFAQNYETQQYLAKANELATLISDSSKGRPSAYRLKIAQTSKPNIEQQLLAQKGLQDAVKKQAEQIVQRGEIFDQILKENQGYQPPNIGSLVETRYKNIASEIGKKKESSQSEPQSFQQEQPESWAQTGLRNAIGAAKSVGAGAAGVHGDVLSSALGAANYLTKPFSEEQLAKNVEGDEDVEKAKNIFRSLNKNRIPIPQVPTYESIQEKLPISFPTTHQASEFIDNLTNGYTKPKNEIEQSIQNIGNLTGSLVSGNAYNKVLGNLSKILSPSAAAKTANFIVPFQGVPWKKSLEIGAASEAGSRAAEFLGSGTEGQMLSRILFGSLASLRGTSGLIDKSINQSYQQAEQASSKLKLKVNPIERELLEYYKDIPAVAPFKQEAGKIIEDTINSLYQYADKSNHSFPGSSPVSQVSASDVIKTKRGVNELFKLHPEPSQPGLKHLPKHARDYPAAVNRILSKHLEPLALQHPEFGKPYALAEDMYKAKVDAGKVNRWFKDIKGHKLEGPTDLTKIALGGLGSLLVGNGAKALKHIWGHPVTRHFYLKALEAATRGNAAAFSKSVNDLEKYTEKNA